MGMKHKRLRHGQVVLFLAALVLVLGLVLANSPATQAATFCVDPAGEAGCHQTIQAAIDAASAGDTINVAAGTYTENITINKNLTLLSVEGRANTTIQGISGLGSLGTVVVTSNTDDVQIGDMGKGFTIIGIDNGNPGIENAAVYFQGAHSNAVVRDNEIRANGDNGLLTEYGVTISDFVIDSNIFSGKTFLDDEPGGCGSGNQFSEPNVPRQLVVMGNGGGDVASAKTTNITFTNNEITGTAGGSSNVAGCETIGQGNTLVTLDVANSTITGNTFAGTTARYGTSLRVRRPGTSISANTFNSGGLSPYAGHIFFENASTFTTGALIANNTFDKAVYGDASATSGTIGVAIQPAVSAASAGGTINVAAGTYAEDVTIDKSLTVNGAQAGVDVSSRTAGDSAESTIQGQVTISANDVTLSGFTTTNPGQGNGILVESGGNNATISQNIVYNVGGENFAGNAQGIYLQDGPDNVSIIGNRIYNVAATRAASAGTAKGIYIGDTTAGNSSDDVLIQDNIVQNITSTANGGSRWGAYGIQVNNKIGTPNLRILNNTIDALDGLWSHAIGLEGPTPNAVVQGNWISNLKDYKDPSDAIAIFFEDNLPANTTKVHFNSFGENVEVGVAAVNSSIPINATNNWWGDASGPSHASNPTGTGSAVGDNVNFDPWLGADVEDVTSQTVDSGDTVSTPDNSVSATYEGSSNPTLTVAKYTGNPGSTSTAIGTADTYFDINLSGNTDSGATLTVDFIFGNGGIDGDPLYWYDGSSWLGVVDNNGNVPLADGDGNYLGVVFGANSSPSLDDLTGTAFTSGASQIRIRRVNSDPIAAGETFQVVVEAASPALYGVEVSLSFGDSVLDVTQVALGGGLAADTIPVNSATDNGSDSGEGRIDFAFAQISTHNPDNVSGTDLLLATLTFYAETDVDPTDIVLNSALFSDKNGNDVVPEILDSPLSVTIDPSPEVTVDVALQGRAVANSGVSLELKPAVGSVLYDTDDSDGTLAIDPVPANTYTARVDAPKYLAAQRPVTIVPGDGVVDLNAGAELILRGGDVNDDDRINIQDLVLIGVNFGGSEESVDINGDGTVNIQDLAIAAGNFGSTSDPGGSAYADPW